MKRLVWESPAFARLGTFPGREKCSMLVPLHEDKIFKFEIKKTKH